MLVTILRSTRLYRGRSNDKCVVTGNVLKRQRSDASSLYYYIYVLALLRSIASVAIEILPIATQQCRNYLYDKS